MKHAAQLKTCAYRCMFFQCPSRQRRIRIRFHRRVAICLNMGYKVELGALNTNMAFVLTKWNGLTCRGQNVIFRFSTVYRITLSFTNGLRPNRSSRSASTPSSIKIKKLKVKIKGQCQISPKRNFLDCVPHIFLFTNGLCPNCTSMWTSTPA